LKLSNEGKRKAKVSADRDADDCVDNKLAAEFIEVKIYITGSS